MRLQMNILEDESSYLQYGQETETEYFSFTKSSPMPSSWIYFPTAEEPSTRYKYISVEINMSIDLISWERQTYSLLDWLGDLGGLYDALYLIFAALISPITMFTLHSTLLTSFFRYRTSNEGEIDE